MEESGNGKFRRPSAEQAHPSAVGVGRCFQNVDHTTRSDEGATQEPEGGLGAQRRRRGDDACLQKGSLCFFGKRIYHVSFVARIF